MNHHHRPYRSVAQHIHDDVAIRRAMSALYDTAIEYRRAAGIAARRHNLAAAAFAADPRTALTGPIEPYSAMAWSSISSAYTNLARCRTARTPRLRAIYLDAAAWDRRRAATFRKETTQ